LYQRLQCRANTSLKLNLLSFFICDCQHHQRKTICLYVYISDIRQIVGYRTPVFIQRFPWHLHITITYNLPHLRLWYADVVTVIAKTQEVSCRFAQTSRQEKDETWSELTWFETIVLNISLQATAFYNLLPETAWHHCFH
jgi:hypothetical protein